MPGGDRGGDRTSGMFSWTFWLMLWKVTCAAEGDVHGSSDSAPVQAKLENLSAHRTNIVT